jgi:hypothetical protein
VNIWVVYLSPSDFPGRVVVRRWDLDQPTDDVAVVSDLQAARKFILEMAPDALHMPRHEWDDPVILESWL